MNSVVEEIKSILDGNDEDTLEHYGMPRRSGRYPWGSGENPYQHDSEDFLSRVEEMRKQNFTFTDKKGKTWTGDMAIAKSMGLSSTQFRTEIAVCKDERRMYEVARVKSLLKDTNNISEIGRIMGKNESSIRSLLNEDSERRMMAAKNTADFLYERLKEVTEKGMIGVDVGAGTEREFGITRERLTQALYLLEREGYKVYSGGVPQVTNKGQQTTQKVLCPPGTKHSDIYQYDKIATIKDYQSNDGGETFKKFRYPESMDSKRLMIRYDEDGGSLKDGIVELRRGVPDLSLGDSKYSQVRILVDNKKYIKGVAVYSDDMPPGVDVIFNTNKSNKVSKLDVLKDIKDDPDNPFGSLIKPNGQSEYIGSDGKKHLSLINKRADQGDWSEWTNALPSQFLSKQPIAMAKKQLKLAKAERDEEFDEIMSLTNPTVKKHLLEKFADSCDSAAVHLKAAALPGQKYHVIIPDNTLKDNEIFAPNYENGTKLALIRYPHGGTFEIPILTVNNKHRNSAKLIGNDSQDAVCITKKNADRLSGADFDGDSVMCIPTNDPKGKVKIKSTEPLDGLKDFDPKLSYPERPGMKYMKDPVKKTDNTQSEMGRISNLISDMTLAGAGTDELAAAVRHSMVVIDAAKHKLDYKRSEQENNIAALRKKYQQGYDKNGNVKYGGASTLISKSKGESTINRRQGSYKINTPGKDWYDPSRPDGAKIWKDADDLYYAIHTTNKKTGIVTLTTTDGKKIKYDPKNEEERKKYSPIKKIDPKTGEVTFTDSTGTIEYKKKARTQSSTNMADTDDPYTLVSPNKWEMELVYADYAKHMKDLGNKARLEIIKTGKIERSKSAALTYKDEVQSLNDKLHIALLNTTKERAAQRMANVELQNKKNANPDMTKGDEKKYGQNALTKYRAELGSVSRKERSINISDREWEAIQAGAISETTLKKILNNTDIDVLRDRATPKSRTTLSQTKINAIKRMADSNYTIDQIAKKYNISPSTVSKYLKGAI